MKRGKRYDTSDIMFAIITELKRKCKPCGHTLLLGNSEKKICNHCGYYVYKNSKIEFKDRLKQELRKH